MDPHDHSLIPPAIVEGLKNYAEQGVPCGDFVKAVVCNDLLEAFKRADANSTLAMPAIVDFVYNDMPSTCHGSLGVYDAWLAFHSGRRQGFASGEMQKLADAVDEARQAALTWRG